MDGDVGTAVVVGVHLDTPDAVVAAAVDAARRWDAALVCVHVVADPLPYLEPGALSGAGSFGDGLPLTYSPPLPPIPDADVEAALRERLAPALEHAAGGWRVVVEHGDPADALARAADAARAALIVVGTQEGRTGVRDFFGATTAAHLAHRQHRPVLVVPA